MKISVALMMLAVVQANASLYSQTVKVDVHATNSTIESIFEQIRAQSDFTFIYNVDDIAGIEQITLSRQGASVEEILAACLGSSDISFVIKDNVIILKKAERQAPQQRVVSGVITDAKGNPLPGATVLVKGTLKGAVADASGAYTIEAGPNEVLEVKFLGMVTREVPVNNRTHISIELEPEDFAIGDVIVTGYQTLSRDRVTGSFGQISSEVIENKPHPDLRWALEGQVAGLTLNKDGQIEIRGVSTFTAEKTPLIVVDGFPVDQTLFDNNMFKFKDGVLEGINPDNVESITVLKDGVAASIYGARAANGVIVITTKKGQRGKAMFTYKGSFQVVPRPDLSNLKLATSSDYIDAQIDLFNANPNSWNINSTAILNEVPWLLTAAKNGIISQQQADSRIAELRNGNFLDQAEEYLYRPQLSHSHSMNITGGGETNLYNIAAHYTGTRENFIATNNDRLILDVRNDWDFNKVISLSTSVNVNYTSAESPTLNPERTGYANSGLFYWWSSGSWWAPYTELVDKNGNPQEIFGFPQYTRDLFAEHEGMKDISYVPLRDIPREMIYTNDLQIRLNGLFRLNLAPGLTGEFGGEWQRGYYKTKTVYENDSYTMRYAYNAATDEENNAVHYIPDGARVDQSRNINQSWTLRAQLQYSNSFNDNKHRIALLAGWEMRQMTRDNTTFGTRLGVFERENLWTPLSIQDWNNRVNAEKMILGQTISLSTGGFTTTDTRFLSWYANGSYEFNDKYIISGSVRWDLTNFFGTDPKYRYKPMWSVGGTWKLSDEDFFNVGFINRLHVRASYGINGNISLTQGPYMIMSLGSASSLTSGGIVGTISSPPNKQLRWERSSTTNIGIDASLFANRLKVTLDYYRKGNDDLLAPNAIDEIIGLSRVTVNAGRMVNNGIEVTLSYDAFKREDFGWNISYVMAYNHNKVKNYNVSRPYMTSYASTTPVQVSGYPADALFGPKFSHLDNEGRVWCYTADGGTALIGNLGPEDVAYQGTVRPPYDMSLTNRFRYKNWDLSFMFIAKLGHSYRSDAFHSGNYNNRFVAERWREPGDEAHTIFPVLGTWNMDMFYFPYVDRLVNKASYMRLRDVTLNYHIPQRIAEKIGISSAKVFVQARNLLLLTHKDCDIDPESYDWSTSGTSAPQVTQTFVGLNRPAEFYVGLQFTF